jgi:hypothetical protein
MSQVYEPPEYFRAAQALGVEAVERDGGKYDAGIIHGVSVITRGEALGHELWVDADFLSDTTAAINAGKGLKARFTHPGLSSDGTGSKLGTLHNAKTVGDQVIADLHFQRAAHKTPDGNLADYVMTLAEETPEQFGLSIVFENDTDRQEAHQAEYTDAGMFGSPDDFNTNNYPHAMLAHLRAGDVVDEPAANPEGLFRRGQEFAQQGEDLLSYVLGLTDAKPGAVCFGVDGDRASQFLARFLERHNLSIQEGGETVSEVETAVESLPTREDFAVELLQYTETFGAENGAAWFAENVSFQDAQGKHIETLNRQISLLSAKVDELQETLNSLDRGEEDGGEFAEANEGVADGPRTFASRIRIAGKHSQN